MPTETQAHLVNGVPWRVEALRRFPELAGEIWRVETPHQLWIHLHLTFRDAYDADNAALVGQIYEFARWCCRQPRGTAAADDLSSCVAGCFYENIPTHPKALQDMPNWWTLKEVRLMKDSFNHLGGDALYAQVVSQFEVKSRQTMRSGIACLATPALERAWPAEPQSTRAWRSRLHCLMAFCVCGCGSGSLTVGCP